MHWAYHQADQYKGGQAQVHPYLSKVSFAFTSPHIDEMNTECISVSPPSLIFLLVAVSLTTIYLPVLVAVFVYAHPGVRRKPIFVLSVTAVLLCLALGGLSIALQVCSNLVTCLSF